jgi:hypothetical protein
MARNKKSRAERFKTKPRGISTKKGTYLYEEIIDSEAFLTLNGAENRLLIGFHRKKRWDRKKKRYTNLQDIVYSLDAMIYETNVSKPSALSARQTLMERGFVILRDQVDWGQFQNNRWEITDRFLKWHPDAEQRKQNGFIEHRPIRKKAATSGSSFPKKQQEQAPVLSVAIAN